MQAPEIDWRYVRMSVSASNRLADAINHKRRECYKGKMIRYTQTTVGLLNAILKRINRATGSARISFSILHQTSGIKSPETIERHIFLLETAGCVKVNRGKAGWNRNAINEFVLIGEVARSFLGENWTPKRTKNRSDIPTIIVGNLTKNNDDDGIQIDTTPDELLDNLKTILDGDVAERVVKQHDRDYLERLYNWVIAQDWANSKGGLFMTKLRAKWNPPMEGEKAKTATARNKKKSEWRTQEDDWTKYLVDEFGNPLRTGNYLIDKAGVPYQISGDELQQPPQPKGIDYRVLNIKIMEWWKNTDSRIRMYPQELWVVDKGGALGYHPKGWAKRGGVETLRGLLREWYPEQVVELVEIVQSVAVA